MNYKTYKSVLYSLIVVGIYIVVLSMGWLNAMDDVAYQFISSFSSSTMTSFMVVMTFLGSWKAEVIVCLICLVLGFRKGVFISSLTGMSALVNHILKLIFQRPRPDVVRLVVESGYSFPSAHAMTSFVLYEMVAYFLWNRHKGLACLIGVLPLFIGISRIYVGVHYASDVIGGYLLGFVFLLLAIIWLKNHKNLLVS